MLRSENARLSGWVLCRYPRRETLSPRLTRCSGRLTSREVASWLLGVVVGAVRIPRARQRQAQASGARDAVNYIRAALSHFPTLR
jgi:hypothetical protein